ncbi:hypothetical protein [Saccharibacillus kuerlensis]|uniref:Peptidase C39-like domain-containing protein n=1 Tax=Saccharibacillus kuerlensis TaxID=459527 RepID=A0ABQ2L2Y2_9BACL|nr:hypothetical protein [Saccharibacillus kuerlensis]GGO00650.1 hypothetical protein GCM10010969_22100 [Saccharibacillus kuerlensis]
MRQNILSFHPYTQWETGIRSPASACGPAAIAGLVRFWEERLSVSEEVSVRRLPAEPAEAVNLMYAACGGTPLGMSAPVLAFGLRRQLNSRLRESGLSGRAVTQRLNGFEAYRTEIDAGRPVAVKFDKWFSLRWFDKPAFDYHWTVGCGYRIGDDGTEYLIVHDAGTRYKDGTYASSRERQIEYAPHRGVLAMIALRIEGLEKV